MSEPLVIFKAIGSEHEKQMLLQKLLSAQTTVTLKDKFERCLSMKVLSLNSQFHLKCHPPEETAMTLQDNSVFSASFQIGSEKYLFETRPVVHENYIALPVTHLYHLQRRKNFRYNMPPNYSAAFVINYLNHNICSHQCRLLDLSTEGCAVEIHQEETDLKLEDLVHAEIFLGDRDPIVIQGVIKNIRGRGISHLTLGVEFNHLAAPCEDKIINSLTDLQRELYFRKAS